MNAEKNTALILIDIQNGFLDPKHWGTRNNPSMEENVSRLLARFRTKGLPVIHVQHHSVEANSPLRPGQEGVQFMDVAKPQAGEPVFTKSVNSAFIGTALESYLRDRQITELTFVGLTTDHCVSTSARMAGNLGFKVTVIEDATATFERIGSDGIRYPASLVHDVALASLRGEFATVLTTKDLD